CAAERRVLDCVPRPAAGLHDRGWPERHSGILIFEADLVAVTIADPFDAAVAVEAIPRAVLEAHHVERLAAKWRRPLWLLVALLDGVRNGVLVARCPTDLLDDLRSRRGEPTHGDHLGKLRWR